LVSEPARVNELARDLNRDDFSLKTEEVPSELEKARVKPFV